MTGSSAFEANFDGLVGPTHNYSGLSLGNVASTSHKAMVSNPREAALQGLEKMKALSDMGLIQGVFPPHERPYIKILHQLGFTGTDSKILETAAKKAPELLSAISSASSMWTANAATVSPSADCGDKKVHFTPANLISKYHRSLETPVTSRILQKIFKNPKYFAHHPALSGGSAFGDEGAANHTRLTSRHDKAGLEVFVYGKKAFKNIREPVIFPARQSYEASSTIARLHQLNESKTVFVQQNPDAIDDGVFHNDVVAVGNENVFLCHEMAYLNPKEFKTELESKFAKVSNKELFYLEVPQSAVSVLDAVQSYLFNSQLVTIKEGHMALIAPYECKQNPKVASYIQRLLEQKSPIKDVHFMDLRQSMQNGGGPACLRLRIVLKASELEATHSKVLMSEKLYKQLKGWVEKTYRDRLDIDDLSDPHLLKESRTALDSLTQILGLGSIYDFQQ